MPVKSILHEFVQSIATKLRARNTTGNEEQEAWWLLEAITKTKKAALLTQTNISLTGDQEKTLEHWIGQYINEKKPLQYILGSVPFCSLEIIVEPPILIPRPETEEITLWLIDKIEQNTRNAIPAPPLAILDLCCGSGCIGLALAKAFPQATIIGTDINNKAIKLAQKNKAYNDISNITFIQSNLFDALEAQNQFDIIISNPPYLSQESYRKVSDEIRLWEDEQALVAQNHGLAIYEQIIPEAHKYLKKPHNNNTPQIVLEFGIDQSSGQLENCLRENNFTDITMHKDLQDKPRWLAASQ